MPTIHRESGYRFYFYARDHEPPHIHVAKDGCEAKFLRRPVRILDNDGFRALDLERIEKMVRLGAKSFEEAWHGHFGTSDR